MAPKGSSGNKNETQCSLIMFCNYMTFHDTRRTDRSYKVSGYPFNGLSIKGPYYLERFLSCMAFSVYEVVRVACQSRSWFVYASRETSAARKRNIMPLKYLWNDYSSYFRTSISRQRNMDILIALSKLFLAVLTIFSRQKTVWGII